MSITSLTFAGFVILVLIAYYALPRRPQNVLLLAVSYVFYATWSWWYLVVLIAITAVNFFLAQRLRPGGQPHRARLWAGIGFNLLALAVFKYEDFFAPDLRARLDTWGLDTGAGGVDLLLPIGMSFYIVAVISYLVDVYRGQATAATDPVDFALYIAYFPKLLSGPIERARTFLPRLAQPRFVDNEVLARSMTLIVVGLTRKIMFADTLRQAFPRGVFAFPERFSGAELTGYLLIYALMLYNDFAGYTSIVRGVSGLFGIELSLNFRTPYFAHNFSDFWNRWHITLSHWLRDYIYFPTSRALLRRNPSRGNIPNILLPPMLTMLASGLWHGTGWNMLLWGALHGLYLIVERMWLFWRPAKPAQMQMRWRQILSIGIVVVLVVLAWVPFRTPDLDRTFAYWRGMLDWSGPQRPSVRVLVVILPALWLDWIQRKEELAVLRWPRLVQATLLALAILAIFLVTQAETSAPFVYQGF
jgi:alginate O-acetyltransferase complex protein AlgI